MQTNMRRHTGIFSTKFITNLKHPTECYGFMVLFTFGITPPIQGKNP